MTVQKRKYAATMAQSIGEMAMLPRRYAVSRRPVKRRSSSVEHRHWGKLRVRSTQPSPRAPPSARTATRERAGSPRRTWVYVEGLPARSQRSMAKQIDPVPSSEAPAVERARLHGHDAEGEVARAQDAEVEERLRRPGQRVPSETRHGGEPTRDGPRRRRQPEHTAWEPEREIAALPVDGAGDDRHLGPESVAAPPRNRLGAARGHVP